MILATDRLDLVAATLAHLDAELESSNTLAELIGAVVPASWPPGEYDRPAIEFFRARLAESSAGVGWYGWYAIERALAGQPATLIGAGGFFGPPDPEGCVEIGYSVVPEHQGRGFATELVGALVRRARATPGVTRIVAHTHSENIASVRVLERTGFRLSGPGVETGTLEYVQSTS